jgi:hypothetical protein
VALSNPKTLIFFGAFFPQFVDPTRDHGPQSRGHVREKHPRHFDHGPGLALTS